MNLDYPPGATPLDPDEAAGLIPSHIANHGQLNEWEMVNIIEGERWAFGRRHRNLLGNEFVCALHKRMFGKTWRWAGKFRTTEKNIGVDPLRIQPALHDLCEDVKTQLEIKSYPLDPQALGMAGLIPKDGPITVTPDGKSIVMKALNNNWVWTYTPTAK